MTPPALLSGKINGSGTPDKSFAGMTQDIASVGHYVTPLRHYGASLIMEPTSRKGFKQSELPDSYEKFLTNAKEILSRYGWEAN